MIQRILIPRGARLADEAGAQPTRRPFSLLDARQLIPGNMQGGPLETRTSIPAHLPLAVLATRQLVPRDTPQTPLDWASVHPDYPPLTILDYRVTVPAATPPGAFQPKGLVPIQDLPDMLASDVITTGEVNLMVEAVEHPPIEWNWVARTGSIMMHIAILLLVVFQARVFPYKPPTQDQLDIARKQLSFIYMPPDVKNLAPARPPAPKSQIRIDPRYVRQLDSINENAIQPKLGPRAPEHPTAEESQPSPAPAPPAPAPAPKPLLAPQRLADLQPRDVESQTPSRGLLLPRTASAGRALQESAQEALNGSGSSQQFGNELPLGPNGGGGEGYLGGDLEMLTPTEGVDFTSYLARIVAGVKRNWFSVMPESARLGDQGRVVLQFRIYRNGMVPDQEPGLMGSSGKEPLDRAAISSIRASSPFPPLPPAFSGPYIELRFMFLYNIPPNLQ
jgi:TonB family protein